MKKHIAGFILLISLPTFAYTYSEIEEREQAYLESTTLKVLNTLGTEIDRNSNRLFLVDTRGIEVKSKIFEATINGIVFDEDEREVPIYKRGKGSLRAHIETEDGFKCISFVTVSNPRKTNISVLNNFGQRVPLVDRFAIQCSVDTEDGRVNIIDELIDISNDPNAKY